MKLTFTFSHRVNRIRAKLTPLKNSDAQLRYQREKKQKCELRGAARRLCLYSDDEEEEVGETPLCKPSQRNPSYSNVDSLFFFRLMFTLFRSFLLLAANCVKSAFEHDYECMNKSGPRFNNLVNFNNPEPRCGVVTQESDVTDKSDHSFYQGAKRNSYEKVYKREVDEYSSLETETEDELESDSSDWETGSNFSEMSTANCRYMFKHCLEHDCQHRDPEYISNLKGRPCAYLKAYGKRTSIYDQPARFNALGKNKKENVQKRVNKKLFSWCNYSSNKTNYLKGDDLYKLKKSEKIIPEEKKNVFNSHVSHNVVKNNNREESVTYSPWWKTIPKVQSKRPLIQSCSQFNSRRENFFNNQPSFNGRQQLPVKFSWSHGDFKRF